MPWNIPKKLCTTYSSYLLSNANLSFIKKESLDIFLNGLNKACYSSYFEKDKTRQTGRHFTIKVSRISNTQTFRIQFVPYMMQNLYKGQNLLALVNNLAATNSQFTREHPLMTFHVFWPFLTYLPTLSYSITSDLGSYLGPPYLP